MSQHSDTFDDILNDNSDLLRDFESGHERDYLHQFNMSDLNTRLNFMINPSLLTNETPLQNQSNLPENNVSLSPDYEIFNVKADTNTNWQHFVKLINTTEPEQIGLLHHRDTIIIPTLHTDIKKEWSMLDIMVDTILEAPLSSTDEEHVKLGKLIMDTILQTKSIPKWIIKIKMKKPVSMICIDDFCQWLSARAIRKIKRYCPTKEVRRQMGVKIQSMYTENELNFIHELLDAQGLLDAKTNRRKTTTEKVATKTKVAEWIPKEWKETNLEETHTKIWVKIPPAIGSIEKMIEYTVDSIFIALQQKSIPFWVLHHKDFKKTNTPEYPTLKCTFRYILRFVSLTNKRNHMALSMAESIGIADELQKLCPEDTLEKFNLLLCDIDANLQKTTSRRDKTQLSIVSMFAKKRVSSELTQVENTTKKHRADDGDGDTIEIITE